MADEESSLPPKIRERIREHALEHPEAETFEDFPPKVREEIREAEREHDQEIAEQKLYEQAEDELRTANTDLHRDRPPADSN